VNENISAAQCEFAAGAAEDPFIRTALMEIAHDEQRHASLAWSTVRWILSEHPHLKSVAKAAFEDAMNTPWASSTKSSTDLSPWGVLSTAAEQAVAERVIRRVIRPCVKALLGEAAMVAVAHE
jgi:hypothetical protein